MDVHVRRAVTIALRLRSVDVLTAQEDGAAELDDNHLLQRATQLGRVLVSQDEDLLREGVTAEGASRLLRDRLCPPTSHYGRRDGGRSGADSPRDLAG